jgi:hypothetical protein
MFNFPRIASGISSSSVPIILITLLLTVFGLSRIGQKGVRTPDQYSGGIVGLITSNKPSPKEVRIFNVRDSFLFQSAYDKNFSFAPSSPDLILPSDARFDFAIIKVNNYLENNPTKRLVIEGWQDDSEQKYIDGMPLGLLRARRIGFMMAKYGISSNQVVLRFETKSLELSTDGNWVKSEKMWIENAE